MCRYKIIASILLILPIINFVFALPTAVQKTRQLCGDVVPDVAITMSAKRGHGDEMEKQGGMYFESLSGNAESELAGLEGLHPFDGLQHPPQMGTSEIQQVSSELSTSPSLDHHVLPPELSNFPILEQYMVPPEPSKSPSLDHHVVPPELSKFPILDHYLASSELSKSPILEQYMVPPESSKPPSLDHHVVPPEPSKIPILDHYLVSPELSKSSILEQYMVPPEPSKSPSLDHHAVVSTNSESGPSPSAVSESGQPDSKSFLGKEFSELKFWRRISGPGRVRDAMNAAQRELQGLVNTEAYVSALFPRVTNVLTP
jgi:hypothetical protein